MVGKLNVGLRFLSLQMRLTQNGSVSSGSFELSEAEPERVSPFVKPCSTSLHSSVRSAQELAQIVREHWHIENRLHWPKDVVLKEDSTPTCAGRAIEGFSILRTLAVNLFRANGYQSITEALDLLAHDINTLFSFLK